MIGKTLGLKEGDIDWPRGQIYIRHNLPIHRQIERPKTKAGRRMLEVDAELLAELKRHIKDQKALVLAGYRKFCGWIFSQRSGEPADYSTFHRAWDRAQKKAKVRQRRPHDLRHAWASWALSDGKPLLWVSKQLGHSSPMVTLQIYARWMPREREEKQLISATNPQPKGVN